MVNFLQVYSGSTNMIFNNFLFACFLLDLLCFADCWRKIFSHQAEESIFSHKCVNGQTLIISLTGEMPANTIENYKDISSGIISYSFSSTSPLFPSFLCHLYVWLCVWAHVNLTDLTQSLSSLETQWSHLISHASDALMNQHTLACQQRGVVVKYTGIHFSQSVI